MRDKIQSIIKHFVGSGFAGKVEMKCRHFPLAYHTGMHEIEIRDFFQKVRGGLFSQSHQPIEGKPIILCFTNRCGSNWLAEWLQATGKLGLADEYFNAERIEECCRNRGLKSLDEVIHYRAQSEAEQVQGSFITKLSWDQLFFFARERVIPDILPQARYVLMKRRNVAAQALSMCVAEQTGQWKSYWNDGRNQPRDLSKISDEQILESMERINYHYYQFERFFALFGLRPVVTYYEDIQAGGKQEILRILKELELVQTREEVVLDESQIKLKKQSDEKTIARVDAFYQSMGAQHPQSLPKHKAA